MMWQTRNNYYNMYIGKTPIDEKYLKDLPDWPAFERFAHNYYMRITWVVIYITIYCFITTAWWQFLFLPITLSISSFQGAAVNWWAHRFGYENFKMSNTSKNILPVDIFFWGEAYHNNHHKHPGRPDNAYKWFEWDMGHFAMKCMHKMGIIKLKLAS